MNNSVPQTPQVQIARTHDAMLQNVSLGVLLTAAFIARADVFPVEWYVGSMLAGFGVINAPAFFGKPRGSIGGFTLALSVGKAAAAPLAWMARHGGPFIIAALVWWISGCVHQPIAIQDARVALNKTGQALRRLRPVIGALCSARPAPQQCDDLVSGYDGAQTGYELAQDVVDAAAAVSQ